MSKYMNLTIMQFLVNRAKHEGHIGDAIASTLAEKWIAEIPILSGGDYLDEYPMKLQMRISKHYGYFLERCVREWTWE